ncbi:MAG: hypothetical protein R3C44_11285 [Chloroflexota bacterium]
MWFQPRPPTTEYAPSPANGQIIAGLLIVGLGLLAFKLLVVDRTATLFRRAGQPAVTQPTAIQGEALRMDGFSLSRETVPAGGTFDMDMAWAAVAAPQVDYQTNVWLVGPNGLTWSDKGTERPRVYEDAPPTRQWAAGEWGWDSREVRVLSGTPPGEYDLVVTLFDKATLEPLTLTDPATGAVIGPTAVVGQVTVGETNEGEIEPQFSLTADSSALGLHLLGYNQDRNVAAPGEGVLLTLFWERLENSSPASDFTLVLQDEAGTAVQSWMLPVTRADYPPASWPEGRPVRGQYVVSLPPDLASGTYTFVIEGSPILGDLQVNAPERLTELPPLSPVLDVDFNLPDGSIAATLAGLNGTNLDDVALCTDERTAGETCRVPLVWQAVAELPTSYHIFLHLVDADGQLLAQTDGIPANWERPTTGWLPGEVILDDHLLTLPNPLPEGPLTLRVGLYDPDTGTRLAVGEADYLTIPCPEDASEM